MQFMRKQKSKQAILVGTQMLSKGHDFKVTLCVILNADGGLLSPDINSVEKFHNNLFRYLVGLEEIIILQK